MAQFQTLFALAIIPRMQNFQITRAGKADYQQIIEVWEASVRATHHFLNEADIQKYKSLIFHEYLDQVSLYCIRIEQNIQGFIGQNGNILQMLFVHPQAIGTGLGKMLLSFAINEKHITLVDVNEQNEQALKFYQHFGFRTIARYDHDAANKPYPILSLSL